MNANIVEEVEATASLKSEDSSRSRYSSKEKSKATRNHSSIGTSPSLISASYTSSSIAPSLQSTSSPSDTPKTFSHANDNAQLQYDTVPVMQLTLLTVVV